MRSTDKNRDKDVGKFFVHTVQLLPKSSCRVLETMKILSVNSENETTLAFKCQVSALEGVQYIQPYKHMYVKRMYV